VPKRGSKIQALLRVENPETVKGKDVGTKFPKSVHAVRGNYLGAESLLVIGGGVRGRLTLNGGEKPRQQRGIREKTRPSWGRSKETRGPLPGLHRKAGGIQMPPHPTPGHGGEKLESKRGTKRTAGL